jgi:hypothetical protein
LELLYLPYKRIPAKGDLMSLFFIRKLGFISEGTKLKDFFRKQKSYSKEINGKI